MGFVLKAQGFRFAHMLQSEPLCFLKEINPGEDRMSMKWILASDIDNTLTGDRSALDKLRIEIQNLRASGDLFLILSTGRRLDQVLDGFEEEGIPPADAVVSQVGTEIYLPPFERGMDPLHVWRDILMEDFSREKAMKIIDGIEGLEMQPGKFNTPLKISCYLNKAEDPEAAAAEIRRRAEYQCDGLCQVVWSSGRDLDLIPAAAGKGNAIRFVMNLQKLDADRVIVAGDSGNDRSMFDEFQCGIVVANAQTELLALKKEHPISEFYFSDREYASGVRDGLVYFQVLGETNELSIG